MKIFWYLIEEISPSFQKEKKVTGSLGSLLVLNNIVLDFDFSAGVFPRWKTRKLLRSKYLKSHEF